MTVLHLKTALEICILWFVIYHILLFFEGTRAIQVLRGMIILLVAFFVIQQLQLGVLEWLMTKLFALAMLAFLILFQPEIRQGLARLGQQHLFKTVLAEQELDQILTELCSAVETLSKNRVGALIAIEKNDPLKPYIETGDLIDSNVSSDLIQTIFTPNSLLHDGGVIVQAGRIAAAGCLFPLTANQELSRAFGTRHRAAIGLSEETDALIIIVSEERHDISLVFESKLYKDLSKEELLVKLKDILKEKG
ncbi:MAG TPA: diadenylate cyclase CdaA [Candidatus Omnitrophota bacterium]|nr:diadenylate cyclase CdaA [Candidatus Omnitrophota bacterium]HRZ15130.1 diadenylate cyclase CdaA [Candidatus Omnitrophota bacterium]